MRLTKLSHLWILTVVWKVTLLANSEDNEMWLVLSPDVQRKGNVFYLRQEKYFTLLNEYNFLNEIKVPVISIHCKFPLISLSDLYISIFLTHWHTKNFPQFSNIMTSSIYFQWMIHGHGTFTCYIALFNSNTQTNIHISNISAWYTFEQLQIRE